MQGSHDPSAPEWDAIDRYLAGQSPSQEAELVRVYLAKHGMDRAHLPAALQEAEGVGVVPSSAKAWERMQREVQHPAQGALQNPRKLNATPREWLGTPASRLGIWGSALAVALIAAWFGVTSRSHDAMVNDTYTTTTGQHARITLADGSHVILGPESQLQLGEHFGTDGRTVTLDGEAYFSVNTSNHVPFIVRTGVVSTRVLGTEFNVRYYTDDPAVSVVVASGKVVASGARSAVTLAAGTMALVTDSTASSRTVTDASAYSEWTRGRLVFEDVPASVMLATLGRWYGREFRLADSTLGARHVSAIIDVHAQAEAMGIVKHLLGVTMTERGDTILLQTAPKTERPATVPRRQAPQFELPIKAGK